MVTIAGQFLVHDFLEINLIPAKTLEALVKQIGADCANHKQRTENVREQIP